MLTDRLGKAWRAQRESTAIDSTMRFSDKGLVLGAGAILAPAGESGRDISIDELRLRALLTAADLRPPAATGLAHLRKAAECWNRGEDGLAAMHLALSGLGRLEQPEQDAHRVFLAAGLLAAGVDADAIIDAVASGAPASERLGKFSPDQPRVAAGSGRTSGQWTTTGSGPAVGSASPADRSPVARPRRGAAPRPTSPDLSSGPGEGEVNPNTVTAIAQPYSGPDACYRAKADCYRNTIEESFSHGQANDNWNRWQREQVLRCSIAETVCEAVGFVVERTPILRRGAVIYPDRGVVISEKGWSDYLYIPAPARGRIPPLRRSL